MTVIFSSYRYFLFPLNFVSCNCCAIENIGSVRTLVNFGLQYDPILITFHWMELHSLPKTVFGTQVFYKVYVISSGTGVETNQVLFFTENRLILLLFLNI